MRPIHFYLSRFAAGLVLLLILATGAAIWLLYGNLPKISGRVELAGLGVKVHVVRDTYGVPHIFASNMNDAARALGYVHASERLFQMEIQRRAGQGRLSEVIGPSMIEVDKFIRTLGLYPLATSSVDALSPEAREYFQAYADGVNAWLTQHPHSLPLEFTLMGFHPEPWKIADSLVWGKLMALQLSHNYKLEILRASLAKKLNAAQMHDLFPPYGDAPVTVPKSTLKDQMPADLEKSENNRRTPELMLADKLGLITGLDHAASNEWVISGSRTDTGKPILANDPHLSLGAPILWFLARIVTPDLTLAGATVPGLPVVLLGQNNSIAWGMTTTGSDVQDLFIETIDPHDATKYRTPSGSEKFIVRDEVIHVKGLKDINLRVRRTRHGPVLSDIDQQLLGLAGAGKVMALAFTGLGAADTTAESLMRINRVSNWSDFLAALKLYQAPPQNVVFANAKGDIGYINPGLLPVRKKGSGTMPVDGASGAYDWVDMVPFKDMPRLTNPVAGVIFNANNAVVTADNKPYLGVDWEDPYRAERMQDFFATHDRQTLDMSAALQADHVSMAARQLLPYLTKLNPKEAKAQLAMKALRTWDGTMDKDRAEPLIFNAWLYQLHRLLFAEKLGDQMAAKGPYAAASIAYILAHDAENWCGKKTCDDMILTAFDDALDMLVKRDGADMATWKWGHEHRATLPHKVFNHLPWLRDKTAIDLASSGDFYTLDRGGSFESDPEHPFARTHGGGYRGLYDLADPARSRFMITTGESDHPLSPHYRDLAPLWVDVKSIPLTGSLEDLEKQGLPRLILHP